MALTQVTATVDKNPVTVKESVILTVTADDDVDTDALDTSALLKDFVVGRTSVSSQTSMINFQTSRTTTWQTVIIPRKTGTILIPALSVEGHQTAPITLTVLDASDPAADTQRDVFITAEVSNTEVYVQQMLTLTVKLHFAAELKRGSLTEPELEGATIAQVGKDEEADTIINGRRYRVIQRTFAVTPQQSGDFELRSPMFSGEIMVQSPRRSNFLSFGETKAISVLGDEVPIKVKPMPTSFQGHWLPSELLTLHQEWQPAGEEYRVGDPITRTITLTAVGVSAEQLPELQMDVPNGLKVYPDQQSAHSNIANGRLVSQTVSNFAIVATKPGKYTLPPVAVKWWNTVTNRQEVTTLPEHTIDIAVNPNAPDALRPVVPVATPASNASMQQPTPAQPTIPASFAAQSSSNLQWLFLGLWLATTIAWLATELIRRKNTTPSSPATAIKTNDAHLALLAACKQNQGQVALQLLVPWFNSVSQAQVTTLAALKQQCNDATLCDAIDQLQSHFYSANSGNGGEASNQWQGKALMVAITDFNKSQKSQGARANGLTLNP